jgi:uncharacterized protein (TIGR03083 family)
MDRLSIIDTESRRLAEVLAVVDPDSRCTTCPDWTAADLLWHLTEVHFFWAGILGRDVRSEADLPAVEGAKPERPAAMADVLPLRETTPSPNGRGGRPIRPSASPGACRPMKRPFTASTRS